MEKKRQISLLVLGLFITIGMVVGVTYALWQVTLQQTNSNVITTGCFNVTLEEGEAITLNNAYPMTNEEGSSLTPYTFTIKNNCSEKASYVLNLETVSSGEKILSDEYVKASLKNSESELFLSTLDSINENLEKVIAEASKAYKLTEGVLSANEEKTFELRLWMDESTPTIDEVMNASYMGKITISSSYVPYKPSNRMIAMEVEEIDLGTSGAYNNTTYTLNGKYSVGKVVYQSVMNPYENAVEIVDFSVDQDKSVLGYYVLNEEENVDDTNRYTLYIQADGKIKVNPKASYYGVLSSRCDGAGASCRPFNYYPGTVEGIENWDTSEVTDMSAMFALSLAESLDLSHFDTRNVTTTHWMFSYSNLTSLNLSGWDTSNVIDMSDMFFRVPNLQLISYGDNFIHKENADVSDMFSSCPANKPTHSSWNDVTW